MHVGKNGNSLPTVDGANLAMQHEGGAQASRVASFAATAMPTTASAVSASAQGLLRHTQPASSVGVLCSDARARPGRRHTKERARCDDVAMTRHVTADAPGPGWRVTRGMASHGKSGLG